MKNYKIMLLFFAFLFVFFTFYNPDNKAKGESEIDLSGSIISADPSANKEKVLDGDYCNPSYWTGYPGNYWQIDLGENKTFVTDTSSFTWPGSCWAIPDLIKNEYSTNGSTWNSLITSASPSVFSCPIAPNQCGGQRYNQVTARYLKFSVSIFCDGGQFFNLAALKLFSSGGGTPTPSSSGTPTPSSSGTPTPSGSIIPSPSISGSDGPGPIVCANPPCVQNPDDPIFVPDENFNIILEVPNGGEKWQIGKKYKIKWHYIDKENRIKSVALFLSKDGGNNFRQVIEQNLPNNKEYEWSIPDDEAYVTEKARVLVAAYGDSIERPLINDTSDNDFKIVSGKTEFIGITGNRLPLTIAALLLFLLSSGAVLWPLTLNFLLNSFITDLLSRLPLLTAPTMGNKKGTGVVYDSYTKSPIPKAMVRIFNAENNKQLESIITNKKGEFSFIIPNGSYHLKVNSTKYDFPSYRLRKTSQELFNPGITDGTYSNLYFGERMLINKENPQERYALNINIPLDKTSAFNLEEKMIKILRVIGNILIKIKWPSIAIGTALSIFSLWSDPSLLSLIILELYLILILYEVYRLLAKSRPYGLVLTDPEEPVDLAVVRFNQNNKIKATSISGYDGKFTAQVNQGDYELSTKKSGFDEDTRNVFIESTRKLEGLDIRLKRI